MEFGDAMDLGKLISGGGAVALAVMVWLELREHRKELASVKGAITMLGETLAKLLERDREREVKDFIREEISDVHSAGMLGAGVEEDVTPIEGPPRRRTPPTGYRIITRPKTDRGEKE